MNPDELLAHDLKAFFMQYMADGKISPSEGLAIASAYVVISRIIKKEGKAHEDTLLSVLGHRHYNGAERNNSQPVWIEQEDEQTIRVREEFGTPLSSKDTLRL